MADIGYLARQWEHRAPPQSDFLKTLFLPDTLLQLFTQDRSSVIWPIIKHNTYSLVTLWLLIYFDRSLIIGFIKRKKYHPKNTLTIWKRAQLEPKLYSGMFQNAPIDSMYIPLRKGPSRLSFLSYTCHHCYFWPSGLTFLLFDFLISHLILVLISHTFFEHVSGTLEIRGRVLYRRVGSWRATKKEKRR